MSGELGLYLHLLIFCDLFEHRTTTIFKQIRSGRIALARIRYGGVVLGRLLALDSAGGKEGRKIQAFGGLILKISLI